MCSGWNIGPQRALIHKVYNTRLQLRNMEDKEHAHRDAHFQEELDSLKASMAHIASLLEQVLRNALSKGPSNRPVTFFQIQATTQVKERVREQGQDP